MLSASFLSHLEELRSRLIAVLIIIFVSFLCIFTFGEQFVSFLLVPLKEMMGDGKIIYIGLLDKIISQLQISFWLAIILSSPLWFYQVWKFVVPALHSHEKKVALPFVLLGFMLFCGGIAFGYFFAFPIMIKTFISFGVTEVEANINLKDYLILACKLLVLCGLAFQLPNLIVALSSLGLVDRKEIGRKRKYVYSGLCVLSAMLTPPDVFTLFMLWVPLVLLFELGLLISLFLQSNFFSSRFRNHH